MVVCLCVNPILTKPIAGTVCKLIRQVLPGLWNITKVGMLNCYVEIYPCISAIKSTVAKSALWSTQATLVWQIINCRDFRFFFFSYYIKGSKACIDIFLIKEIVSGSNWLKNCESK